MHFIIMLAAFFIVDLSEIFLSMRRHVDVEVSKLCFELTTEWQVFLSKSLSLQLCTAALNPKASIFY